MRIRPLAWTEASANGRPYWTAITPLGLMGVGTTGSGQAFWTSFLLVSTDANTVEAAKRAAEAFWHEAATSEVAKYLDTTDLPRGPTP